MEVADLLDPNSLSGQRLLLRSAFHTGHFPTTSTLIPAVPTPSKDSGPNGTATNGDSATTNSQQVLITTMSGSLALLSTLDESAYRRLSMLQEHFQGAPNSLCGLNAFDYRNVASEGFATRGMIDGSIVARGWAAMSARARSEATGKMGVEGWILRGDLETTGTLRGP